REAALYFSGLREELVYGVRVSAPPEVVTDTIRKRTWGVCGALQEITADNLAKNGVDFIRGTARLGPERSIVVSEMNGAERTLSARIVLIATGSRPARPSSVAFDIPGVCDTNTILQLGRVPKEIVIIGGGPVGVEFATICHALGAKVTLAERGSRLI